MRTPKTTAEEQVFQPGAILSALKGHDVRRGRREALPSFPGTAEGTRLTALSHPPAAPSPVEGGKRVCPRKGGPERAGGRRAAGRRRAGRGMGEVNAAVRLGKWTKGGWDGGSMADEQVDGWVKGGGWRTGVKSDSQTPGATLRLRRAPT